MLFFNYTLLFRQDRARSGWYGRRLYTVTYNEKQILMLLCTTNSCFLRKTNGESMERELNERLLDMCSGT